MAIAQDIHGAVFKNGSAVLLARVVGGDGVPIKQADVSSIRYTVLEIDECYPDSTIAITGHEGVSLPIAAAFFDTLQTDALWNVDSEGYNFRHEIDVGDYEAFPKAGASYRVRYEVAPVNGQKMVFRFHLKAI